MLSRTERYFKNLSHSFPKRAHEIKWSWNQNHGIILDQKLPKNVQTKDILNR